MSASEHAYFMSRSSVDPDGCWIWQLHVDVRGYGRMHRGGANGYLAHRASYESFVGPIPPDMTIDHLCFKPACINPDHLRVATLEDNAARQRRAMKSHCLKGHEFTPENTYRRPLTGEGRRQCRTCNAAAQRRYKAKKRSAA